MIKWLSFGLALVAALPARSQDAPSLSFEFEATARSRYVWRGIVLQPKRIWESSAVLAFDNAWLNVWSYAKHPAALFFDGADEVDLTVGYDFGQGNLSFSPTFTYYTYSGRVGDPPSGELGLFFAYDWGAGWTLRYNQYLQVSAPRGVAFAELGAEFSRELAPACAIEVQLLFGSGNRAFNRENWAVEKSAWNVASGEVALRFHLAEGLEIRPAYAVHRNLDADMRRAAGRTEDRVWSVTLTYAR